jgi:hypothetical protein
MNSKALAASARRLEGVQKLLSDLESFKRKVTDSFADGLIDQAACQQARMGAYHAETGLRAFALAEEKAYERAGGGFFRRDVGPSGMLRRR